jgi:NADH dehydrogenase [ubiquinone] 1 alpha subcomplex assembly factor 7
MTEQGWREVLVDNVDVVPGGEIKSAAHESKDGETIKSPKFRMVLANTETAVHKSLTHKLPKNASVGSRIEISPLAERFSKKCNELLGENGVWLCVDYGFYKDLGGVKDVPRGYSLRGIKNHELCDPFTNPGLVDLSVDVDFETGVFAHCRHSRVMTQRDFLMHMGISARCQMISQSVKDPKISERLKIDLERLVGGSDVGGMGDVYLCVLITGSPDVVYPFPSSLP